MDHVRNHHLTLEKYKSSHLVKPDEGWPNDVYRSLVWINDHIFGFHCSVQKMRKECLIPQKNFSSKFKNFVGSTPCSYIRSHRVYAAQVLEKLSDSRIKKAEVGFAVGYLNPSAFSKAIKSRERM